MRRYVTLNKKVGETPLQVLEAYRKEKELPLDLPLAYAGRLDPMASGKLLVLIGDECKKQATYHNLDKEYVFEILVGFESDTGDVLGLAKESTPSHIDTKHIKEALKSFTGDITLPYPVFSSKTVKGKPLFLWQLEGKIDEITIPTKESTIYELSLLDLRLIKKEELEEYIFEKIDSIPPVHEESKALGADFRRGDIRERWTTILADTKETSFQVLTISCVCSSGTYMRSLAAHIAQKINTTGLAYSINRTIIGRYVPIPLIGGFWTKTY